MHSVEESTVSAGSGRWHTHGGGDILRSQVICGEPSQVGVMVFAYSIPPRLCEAHTHLHSLFEASKCGFVGR